MDLRSKIGTVLVDASRKRFSFLKFFRSVSFFIFHLFKVQMFGEQIQLLLFAVLACQRVGFVSKKLKRYVPCKKLCEVSTQHGIFSCVATNTMYLIAFRDTTQVFGSAVW